MSEDGPSHDPLRKMLEGHEQVSEWLHALGAAAHLLASDQTSVKLEEAQRFFASHVRDHFAFEEQVLFPALLAVCPTPELISLTEGLRREHVEILLQVSSLFRALAMVSEDGLDADNQSINGLLSPVVERIMAHARREDLTLIPLVAEHREALSRLAATSLEDQAKNILR